MKNSLTVILIYSFDEIKDLHNYLTNNIKIISFSPSISSILTKNKLKFSKIAEYFDKPLLPVQLTFQWMKSWIYQSTNGNYTFLDLFNYNKMNFWWLIHNEVIYSFQKRIQEINELTKIISLEKPKKLVLFDKNHERIDIIKKISKKNQIEIKIINKEKKTVKIRNKGKRILKKYFQAQKHINNVKQINKWAKSKQKHLDAFNLNIKKQNNVETRKKVLFLSGDSQWRASIDPNKKRIKENYYFNQLYDALLIKGVEITDLHCVLNISAANKIIDEKLAYQQNIKLLLLQSSFITFPKKIANHVIRKIMLGLRKHFSSETLMENWYYNGINLKFETFNLIEQLIKINVPLILWYIEFGKKLIIKESPDRIVLINETGLIERSIILASKERNIPCFSIQHGLISKDKGDHLCKLDDDHFEFVPKPPLPDKMFVYGEIFRNILLDISYYQNSQVMDVGNPIWDELSKTIRIFEPINIKKSLKIPTESKILMYSTQPIPDGSNLILTEELFNFFETLEKKEYFLVVKVHPREKIETYQRYNITNLENILFLRDESLSKLLSISDLLITGFSTTILDALIFNVPAIAVISSHSMINSFFYETGISYNSEIKNLESTVNQALTDKETGKFDLNRQELIKKIARGLDQNSTERMISIILEFEN
jgi:hypothetical protein